MYALRFGSVGKLNPVPPASKLKQCYKPIPLYEPDTAGQSTTCGFGKGGVVAGCFIYKGYAWMQAVDPHCHDNMHIPTLTLPQAGFLKIPTISMASKPAVVVHAQPKPKHKKKPAKAANSVPQSSTSVTPVPPETRFMPPTLVTADQGVAPPVSAESGPVASSLAPQASDFGSDTEETDSAQKNMLPWYLSGVVGIGLVVVIVRTALRKRK
jgi:hypothetical protein